MAKARILIVEDDAIVATDIRNRVGMLGFEVCKMVSSGCDAVTQAGEKRPDLILMDIKLRGEMDGIEAAEEIRTRFNIPIVYLTAYADEKVLERTKKTEPFGYIVKPFDDRGLNVAIEIALYKYKMEKRLKESEEWLSITLMSIGDAVIATDNEGSVTFMNPVAEMLAGWNLQEAAGRPLGEVLNIVNRETRCRVDLIERVLREGGVTGFANHRLLISRDGTEHQIADSAAPIKVDDDPAKGLVVVFRDITKECEIQRILKENEERFRLVATSCSDLIYDWDLKTNEIHWFGDIVSVLGYDMPSAAVQEEALHPEDRERVKAGIQAVLEEKSGVFAMEYRMMRHDGTWCTWIDRGGVILDEEGEPYRFVGACTDITRERQREEEARQLQKSLNRAKKMEAIGLLAGGVAHDLNNILSGIVGYPEMLLMQDDLDPRIRKALEIIEGSGKRAAFVVEDLMTMVRGVAGDKKVFNLNNIIKEYLISPENIKLQQDHQRNRIRTGFAPDLLSIKGSPVHIRKVVMNLVSNATEAIPGEGIVDISTQNRYLDMPLRGYDDIHAGEYVMLIVKDNGTGISRENIEKIFEPFYTKKMMGRGGTGLGLTVVWNTVQDHGGYINVTSDENGTTFELYFPVAREEILGEDSSVSIEDLKGRGETILIVDDVESQREIAHRMLKFLGYKTSSVSSGEEALEYLKQNSADVIVLDMIMGLGMNGCETYERIVEICPNQKAVIASGYAETEDVKKAQALGAGKFIKKPYSIEKIGSAVKEELDRAT